MTHELSLGFIGRNGAYPANQARRHADLVLGIGARFDDRSASSWLPGYSWSLPADARHPRGRSHLPAPAARRGRAAGCGQRPARGVE